MAEQTAQPKKSWYEVKAVDDGRAEIFIYDEIGLWGVPASDFVKSWRSGTRNATRVDLHINSPGGNLADAFAIYNIVRGSKKDVTVYVDGWAASAASLIVQAGDRRLIAENALLMMHNPWTFASGDAAEMRKAAEMLDKFREGLVKTYTERSGKSEEEVVGLLDAETWYVGDEAVEAGFADEVFQPGEDAKAYACARFDPRKYQGQYKNLRPEFVHAVAVDGAPVEENVEETADMPESKKDESKVPETTIDPEAIAQNAVKAERERVERIQAAAFDGQDEVVAKLVKDGTDYVEALEILHADFKKRGADIFASMQRQSDKVEHRNEGGEDAPTASVDDLEKTMVKAYRNMGHDQAEAERRAKAFVGK